MDIRKGTTVSHYRIVEQIGAGGMGVVYRAHDERLDRDVAIKVLPEEVADDPDRLARFEREARAVAKLDHPNILAIHDFGTEGGVTFAVAELLEGESLRERIPSGGLSWQKATEIGAAVAKGLAAAHGKGVVHRDLKPENIFITADGRLKILDFGLAQVKEPVEHEAETATLTPAGTAAGTVMGTLGYMSPEQLRGEPADGRSDIFALGCVLYEMVAGKAVFLRPTTAETTAAILKEEPPSLSDAGTSVPAELERTIRRCLEKSPEARFQSAQDLAFALEAVSRTSDPVRVTGPRKRRWIWLAPLMAISVAVVLWIGWPREPTPPLRIRPITSDTDEEWGPALSPDGNQVAYSVIDEDQVNLYVRLIDGGEPLHLAKGGFAPAWSPDGLRITFARHLEGDDGEEIDGVFVVPALGGTARQLATVDMHWGHGLSWSPDHTTLALADRESPDVPCGICLLSLESGERRKLTTPPTGFLGDFNPRFSPDGRTLVFIRKEAPFVSDVYITSIADGEERRLTEGSHRIEGLDWAADGKSIVFSSWRKGGAGVISLWRARVSGGDPEPLGFGEFVSQPTISRRGGRLAFVQARGDLNIWRIGGPSTPEDNRSSTRLISSTQWDYHASYSPDGRQIAFASMRTGAGEIWVCDADGSNPRQLTFLDDPMTMSPVWSPDGERIAFISAKEGMNNVYVVGVSGGMPKRLTTGPFREIVTSWSRDGRWIYFFSNRSGRNEVWRVSPDGGEPVQLTTKGGAASAESFDGRFLYFGKADITGEPPGIWRIPRNGGEEIKVLDCAGGSRWTIIEQGIVYVNHKSEPQMLELIDPASGEVGWAAPLEVPVAAQVVSVSPDGRWVLYTSEDTGVKDLMLVENFR
jgi:serine/threonine protein kinase/Tol biopolymer transport system component